MLHTAGSAGLRDYRPVLVEDAVGYIEDEHSAYALEHADWLFGERRPSGLTFADGGRRLAYEQAEQAHTERYGKS